MVIDIKNDLLHGKNIEALVNILNSYEDAYQGTSVSVFFEHELYYCTGRFNNMFALSWGKVRFGHQLVIRLEGNGNIQDISRLEQYLGLAAGEDYEQFINPYSNEILKIFEK